MIIQSKGIKNTSSMGARLNYINKNDALVYTKHMFSYHDDIEGLENEFIQNAKYLEGARGSNIGFSETLSMPISENISKEEQVEALKVLIDEHITLRGFENHPAVIAIHTDAKHTHAHCLFSSNALFGTQRHRVSRKTFKKSQVALEEFRNKTFKHFPKTNHYSQNKLEKHIKNAEGKMRYLRKAITDKQKITSTFKHALTKTTKKEFQEYLKNKNLIVYKRGAKTIGLRDTAKKKVYRLNTLQPGLRETYLAYEKKLNIKLSKQIKQTQEKVKPKPVLKKSKQSQKK
ncbi:MAG: relaxase/mobilization nuclease domain-containing protein [Sulfurimonas sp.]|nr:relaxase/mobilization nuclease domain-containing protein [Sulfurimonas sp.]